MAARLPVPLSRVHDVPFRCCKDQVQIGKVGTPGRDGIYYVPEFRLQGFPRPFHCVDHCINRLFAERDIKTSGSFELF